MREGVSAATQRPRGDGEREDRKAILAQRARTQACAACKQASYREALRHERERESEERVRMREREREKSALSAQRAIAVSFLPTTSSSER